MEVPVYFEDLVSGASFMSGEVTVDNEEMLAYNRSGDRVRLRIAVKSKRESSRPGRGHFDLLYELLNQEGDVVLSVLMAGLIERRPPA